MSLNSLFIGVFLALGLFALLLGIFPVDFLLYQYDYENTTAQDKTVLAAYDANNLNAYNQTWYFNMTFPSQHNLPDTPSPDHQIECHWIDTILYDWIEFRHAQPGFMGWYMTHHKLMMAEPYRSQVGFDNTPSVRRIYLNMLETLEGNTASGEGAFFEMYCDHVRLTVYVIATEEGKNLTEGWNDGALTVLSTYKIDFESMKGNAWSLITSILMFQSPEIGVSGDWGYVVNGALGLVLWAMIGLLVFAAITSLIPFVPGWSGGD